MPIIKSPALSKIDRKDSKILRILDMDARIPMKQLAKKVGISRQVAEYRVERMAREGTIGGFFTVFDSAVVGKRWFRIVLQMRRITSAEKQAFIDFFKAHPDVLWLGEVGGNWDFVINFVTDDQFSFEGLFNGVLKEWGGSIQRYEVLVYINVRDQQRRYLLEDYESEPRSLVHRMEFDRDLKLDALDKKIIRLISKDAALPYSKIASSLDVSYKTVQSRMKAMEQSGLILGYRAIANPGKTGYESYMLFLGTNAYDAALERQLNEFLKHPNVTYVVRQLGRWRIGIEAEFRDRNEFQAFLVELRTRFGEMISEYEAFPIFFDHKIDYFPEGALSETEEEIGKKDEKREK